MTRKTYNQQRRTARAIARRMTNIETTRKKIAARILATVTAFNGTITHTEPGSNES